MKITTQRHDPLRLFGKRLLIAVLGILVIVGASGVWNVYRKERASAVLRDEAQAALADLSQREATLRSDVASLGTERGKEAAVRSAYQVGAPGENLIVIVDPKRVAPVAATSTGWRAWMIGTLRVW